MPGAGQGVLSERAAQLLLNREPFAAHVSQNEVFGSSVFPKTKCLAFPFFPNACLGVCLPFFFSGKVLSCVSSARQANVWWPVFRLSSCFVQAYYGFSGVGVLFGILQFLEVPKPAV